MSVTVFGNKHGGILVEDAGNVRRAFGPVFEDRDEAECFVAWWTRYGPSRVEWMAKFATDRDTWDRFDAILAQWRATPPCVDCGHPRGLEDEHGLCAECTTAAVRARQRRRFAGLP